jgi:hypothetical protein
VCVFTNKFALISANRISNSNAVEVPQDCHLRACEQQRHQLKLAFENAAINDQYGRY